MHLPQRPICLTENGNNPVKLFWNNRLNAFRDYRQTQSVTLSVIRLCLTMTAAFDSSYNKTDRTLGDDGSATDKHLADYAAHLLKLEPRSAALQSISEDLNDEMTTPATLQNSRSLPHVFAMIDGFYLTTTIWDLDQMSCYQETSFATCLEVSSSRFCDPKANSISWLGSVSLKA